MSEGSPAVAAARVPVLGAGAHLLGGVELDLELGVELRALLLDGHGDLQEFVGGGAGCLKVKIVLFSNIKLINKVN